MSILFNVGSFSVCQCLIMKWGGPALVINPSVGGGLCLVCVSFTSPVILENASFCFLLNPLLERT